MSKNTNWLLKAFGGLVLCTAVSMANAATVQWEGQSPIDFNNTNTARGRNTERIRYRYGTETIILTNTYSTAPGAPPKEWGTLKARPQSGPAFNSYVTVNGEKYVLAQFHFHTESEHTLNGSHTPMEVHFVHLRVHANGEPYCIGEPQSLLVIGAFIIEGKPDRELDKIFSLTDLPEDSSEPNIRVPTFDFSKVLPNGASFRYHGSLTAPSTVNCTTSVNGAVTEIYNSNNTGYNSTGTAQLGDHTLGDDGSFPEAVSWVVMEKPITMSAAQIAAFEHLFDEGNSRPVQEDKGRAVHLVH